MQTAWNVFAVIGIACVSWPVAGFLALLLTPLYALLNMLHSLAFNKRYGRPLRGDYMTQEIVSMFRDKEWRDALGQSASCVFQGGWIALAIGLLHSLCVLRDSCVDLLTPREKGVEEEDLIFPLN